MNAGQRSARRLALRPASTADSICTSCLLRLSQTPKRTAATAAAQSQSSTPSSSEPAMTASATHPAYNIMTGVVLSRPPLLTRTLHPFEKAFYLYQRRLNERLALPFTRYFYYKKGTPGDADWKRKAKTRLTPARDIGVYNAYGAEGWNDELLVGDKLSEPEVQMQALVKDAAKGDERDAGPVLTSRVTEADEKKDLKSLNRLLERTVYLLVKNKEGWWRFPEDELRGKEGFNDAAERILVQSGGVDMNTWVVGNAPIGHFALSYPEPKRVEEKKRDILGDKVFFMKARIMAGKPDMSKNVFGVSEHRWLAKEEIEKVVSRRYWSSIRDMLVDR